MKRYRVRTERAVTFVNFYDVEAAGEEEARDMAATLRREGDWFDGEVRQDMISSTVVKELSKRDEP